MESIHVSGLRGPCDGAASRKAKGTRQVIRAEHPPWEDPFPRPGKRAASPCFIIPASCHDAALLFSATFRINMSGIQNSSGCKTSTNFISAGKTTRLPPCSCSTDIRVALGGLHEGPTPDLIGTTSLALGLKRAEGKRPGQFSDWDFWFERVLMDLHGNVLWWILEPTPKDFSGSRFNMELWRWKIFSWTSSTTNVFWLKRLARCLVRLH